MTTPRTRSIGLDVLGSALLALVAVRCYVLVAPRRYFDVDPAFDPTPLAGFGATGSLIVDALLLLVSAVVCARAGAPARRAVILAALPIPWVIAHAFTVDGVHDAQFGVAWASAVVAALAVHVLAADPRRRRVMLALLLGVLGPFAARAALQMDMPAFGYRGAEFAATIAEYEQNEARILADRGWAPESSAALIFERRVRQAQPSGWFVTTNVFATLVVAIGLGAGATALAAWRTRAARPAAIGMVVIAGCAAAMLIATGSRGAIGAGVIAAFVVGAIAVWRGGRRLPRAVVVAVPVVVLLGVIARGHVLPESFGGELSVLFRSQYLDGAAATIADAPLTGVGPAGFQAAYVAHRPARSPEEVASAHNAFAEWLTAFGVIGVAWIVLALAALARAVPMRHATDDDRDDDVDAREPIELSELALPLLALLAALLVEALTLPSSTLTMRGIGLAAGGFVAIIAARAFAGASERGVGLITLVMALAFVAHAQLDMTWGRPSAVAWGWALLALAAPARRTMADDPTSRDGRGVAAATLALCAVVIACAIVPALRADRARAEAAAVLAPIAELSTLTVRLNNGDRSALPELAAHARTLGATDADLTEERYGGFVRRVEAALRLRAATRLLDGGTFDTTRLAAREAATAIAAGADPAAGEAFALALAPAIDAGMPSAAAALHRLERACGRDGLDAARRLVELDPNGLSAWRLYADALWAAGARREAAAAYARVLEIDANFELDPLKQLSDGARDEARARARASE